MKETFGTSSGKTFIFQYNLVRLYALFDGTKAEFMDHNRPEWNIYFLHHIRLDLAIIET